ncbi:MAG: SDR family oxidoreductase [Bacteroidetes bacterium]|nr:MAG: SDR family oxidoreductase [Bacteroidota bacterium]
MNPAYAFSGKHILVTGAGQGIGYAICRDLALAGAIVTLNDLDGALAQSAADQINTACGEFRVWPAGGDISDLAVQSSLFAEMTKRGPCYGLVANAGITSYGPFLDCSPEMFARLTEVNLRGSFFSAQMAARQMISAGIAGRILFMSSVTGVQAHENLGAYGMTKAALMMLAKTLALELGPYGITVNALAPGATLTERTRELDSTYEQGWNAVAPLGRTATVEDISAAACYFLSSEARHVTGQTLVIDGGWTLHSPLPGRRYQ